MASLFPTPRPPHHAPDLSIAVIIVAALFLIAVFLFYFYTV